MPAADRTDRSAAFAARCALNAVGSLTDHTTCRQGPTVRIVWVEEWYDGAATGVAEHSGQRYWFTPLADDWYLEHPRRLVLRRLVAQEASSLDERMEDSGRLPLDEYWSKYHPTDRNADGYEAHDGEVVGWFTEPPTG